jgi:uncharacterized membrane protein YuzA (DUF378 family)
MYPCPHCQQPTIGFMRKWLSWRAAPAQCPKCTGCSCIAAGTASAILATCAVVATLVGFAAAALQAVYPLILGGAGIAVFYAWCQHRAKLLRISEAEQKSARRPALVMLLLVFFPGFF